MFKDNNELWISIFKEATVAYFKVGYWLVNHVVWLRRRQDQSVRVTGTATEKWRGFLIRNSEMKKNGRYLHRMLFLQTPFHIFTFPDRRAIEIWPEAFIFKSQFRILLTFKIIYLYSISKLEAINSISLQTWKSWKEQQFNMLIVNLPNTRRRRYLTNKTDSRSLNIIFGYIKLFQYCLIINSSYGGKFSNSNVYDLFSTGLRFQSHWITIFPEIFCGVSY
jgi:hypothetical protein